MPDELDAEAIREDAELFVSMLGTHAAAREYVLEIGHGAKVNDDGRWRYYERISEEITRMQEQMDNKDG